MTLFIKAAEICISCEKVKHEFLVLIKICDLASFCHITERAQMILTPIYYL